MREDPFNHGVEEMSTDTSLLMKMFSLEFLVSAVVAIFALGAVYTSLNSDLAIAQDTSVKNKEKLVVVSEDLSKIKTNIAVIQANQDNMTRELQAAASNAQETQRDVKEILRILGEDTRLRMYDRNNNRDGG